MNGAELMQKLLECDQARSRIPLQLQATLPLVGRRGKGTAECWYYRLTCGQAGVTVDSPARYVLWDIRKLEILEIKALEPTPLGDAQELLTREHREKEDACLAGMTEELLEGELEKAQLDAWLEAAPGLMREWLKNDIKERC